MDEVRYTRAEIRARIARRRERIVAAVGTGLLVHEEGRELWAQQRVVKLPDGGFAYRQEDVMLFMANIGKAAFEGTAASILNAIFDEEPD